GLKFGRPGAGNLASGNGRGISLEYGGGAVVQGNVIGLNALQNQALPNQTYGGIDIVTSANRIGGSAAGEGNVVAGNDSGITLYEGSSGNRIEGNFLGVNASLSATFGNGYANVMIYDGSDNVIGGTATGAGNVISGSYAAGIFQYLGLRNAILGNRIYGNGRLDIEQLPLGPAPNDAGDTDHGPNEGQNWPAITAAIANGGSLSLSGSLTSRPDADYRIEFFHSAACHPSGMGGGETLLGAATVHSDAAGQAVISANVASAATAGVVTATATDADGNTSEFSPCVAVGQPGAGQFSIWRDPVLAYEDLPQLEIAVARSHGFAGSASVRLTTVNGSAAAPGDFAAVDTTLTFAPGEALKIVTVPLVLDDVTEGNETFRIKLQNPGNGATLGARADVEVSLFDHSGAYPFVRISDAVVSEPVAGQSLATFVVSLSGTDHPVNLDVYTVDASARAGLDYVPTQTLLSFLPGETSKTFSVPVLADNQPEGDEVFYVKVTGHDASAFIADDLDGEGTIHNTGGSDGIFANAFEAP
ncbi:MAG TPA: Calx-beta domain-containing protein, partial [Tahibacter sp.]|nr:Calx-beta domain-containing protein [Tahibacter sp.]